MNWIEIKDKYPKAYKEFIKWHPYLTLTNVTLYGDDLTYDTDDYTRILNPRLLYDFFYDNGIITDVNNSLHDSGKSWFVEVYKREAFKTRNSFYTECLSGNYKDMTRAEAESIAFTEAFSVLEIKLG